MVEGWRREGKMKRRIMVLCLLLALLFMAMAVPADANIFTMGKMLEDPGSPNRFCSGNTIDYGLSLE